MRFRLSAGLIAQGYNQAITVGVQLISVPFLLSFWGVETYGTWLLISAIPAYLALADLGFAQVGASDMTMRVARDDQHGASVTYHTIFSMNCVLGLIGFTAMASFALSPLGSNLVGEEKADLDAQLSLVLLACHALFSLLQGIIGAGMRSVGKFSQMIAFFASARLLDAVLVIVAAALNGGLLDAALLMVIGRTVTTTLILTLLVRSHPWLRPGFHHASIAKVRELLSPTLFYMGYMLGNLVSIQGMLVVVGVVFGPAAVAVAGTARTLARLGVNGAQLLNQILAPEYSIFFGRCEVMKLKRVFAIHISVAIAASILFSTFMVFFGSEIYEFWTKAKTVGYSQLLVLLILASAADMIWTTLQAPAVSANRLRVASLFYLLTSVAGIAAMLLFARQVGLVMFGYVALTASIIMIGAAFVENRLTFRSFAVR